MKEEMVLNEEETEIKIHSNDIKKSKNRLTHRILKLKI